MEFLQSPVGVVVSFGVALLALWTLVQQGNRLYKWLKYNTQGYPHEAVIEEALLPYLYEALMVAYKGSETLMDTVGERLRGADKARIARLVYAVLPDSVSLLGVSWQWKKYVTQGEFAGYLQKRFDSFVELWDVGQEGVLKAIMPEKTMDDTFRIKLPDVTRNHPSGGTSST